MWRAWRPSEARDVAVKVLHRDEVHVLTARHLRRSGRVLRALEPPYGGAVLDTGHVGGHVVLVSRLVPGTELGRRVHRDGRWTPRRAVDTVTQLATCLDAVHRAGLVHGALHPRNVRLSDVGGTVTVGVVDLGLTRTVSRPDDTSAVVRDAAGAYLAPEVLDGDLAVVASDVYGTAALLHLMLTGSAPGEAPPEAYGVDDAPGTADARSRLLALAAQGLAESPADRPASVQALADAAVRALDEEPATDWMPRVAAGSVRASLPAPAGPGPSREIARTGASLRPVARSAPAPEPAPPSAPARDHEPAPGAARTSGRTVVRPAVSAAPPPRPVDPPDAPFAERPPRVLEEGSPRPWLSDEERASRQAARSGRSSRLAGLTALVALALVVQLGALLWSATGGEDESVVVATRAGGERPGSQAEDGAGPRTGTGEDPPPGVAAPDGPAAGRDEAGTAAPREESLAAQGGGTEGWGTLDPGVLGPQVRAVQWLLVANGSDARPDGVYDADLSQVLRDFQVANGIAATGQVDPATWQVLAAPLARGDVGPRVRALQQLLKVSGPVAVDGSYDRATVRAVTAFQRANQLDPNGTADAETWQALSRAWA